MTTKMIEKIQEHYTHAKAKHPYFCDMLTDIDDLEAKKCLTFARNQLKRRIEDSSVRMYDVISCEIYEAEHAMAKKDIPNAIEECYDAIAVFLRVVDVLEGRQALGNPIKGESK